MLSMITDKPKKAGEAILVYGVEREDVRADGRFIYLTGHPKDQFYSLQEGEQFLFNPRGGKKGGQPLFGGTDGENVFLSPIYVVAFDVFLEKGEAAFYQALRPEIVREMEKHFQAEIRRQGDIFAVSLGSVTWENLNLLHALLLHHSGINDHRFVKTKEVDREPIFATRHTLTGKMTATIPVQFVYCAGPCPIVQGVLDHPNHESLVLEELHLLARSEGVIYRNNGDAD